jgi:hypothetical protein
VIGWKGLLGEGREEDVEFVLIAPISHNQPQGYFKVPVHNVPEEFTLMTVEQAIKSAIRENPKVIPKAKVYTLVLRNRYFWCIREQGKWQFNEQPIQPEDFDE